MTDLADPTTPTGAAPDAAPATNPNPPVWSGRRTAVTVALAIGISSVAAVAAAAALPVGSAQGGSGLLQPGGFGGRGQGGFGQGGRPGVAPADPRVATP
jgi:hypothetical protein